MSATPQEQKLSELLDRLAMHANTEPPTRERVIGLPPRPGRRWTTALVAAVVLAVVLAGTALARRDHSGGRVIRSTTQAPALPGGTTEQLAPSGLAGRSGAASVWTGKELLVWGGSTQGPRGGALADGAALDPSSNRWRPIPPAPIAGRADAAVAWAGREMVVALGTDATGARLLDGAAFDPETNRWRPIAPQPFDGAFRPATVWTGTELVVVASANGGPSATAYDPAADRWRRLTAPPGSLTMPFPQVVWTGSEAVFVLWPVPSSGGGPPTVAPVGGPVGTAAGVAAGSPSVNGSSAVAPTTGPAAVPSTQPTVGPPPPPPATLMPLPAVRGPDSDMFVAAYSPAADGWTRLPPVALKDGTVPRLVWTGKEVLALQNGEPGAAFDPKRQTWRPVAAVPPDGSGFAVNAVWTGRLVLLWAGGTTGLAYDPTSDAWWTFDAGDLPVTSQPVVAWADGFLVGWGGLSTDPGSARLADAGIRYRPPKP